MLSHRAASYGYTRTHSSLRAYARRRGVVDADDLVQTALCDALAVGAVPIEEAELPRWVTGIARHKVKDEHRRRARGRHVESSELADSQDPDAAALLRQIDADIVDAEQRRTLGWLVREHAGDSLCEIAREEALNHRHRAQRVRGDAAAGSDHLRVDPRLPGHRGARP